MRWASRYDRPAPKRIAIGNQPGESAATLALIDARERLSAGPPARRSP